MSGASHSVYVEYLERFFVVTVAIERVSRTGKYIVVRYNERGNRRSKQFASIEEARTAWATKREGCLR